MKEIARQYANEIISALRDFFLPAEAADAFEDPKQADICCPAAAAAEILKGFKFVLRLGQAGKPDECEGKNKLRGI